MAYLCVARPHAAVGSCLEENTILDFVSGRLAPSAIHEVEQHLDGCERCQQLLSCARPLEGARDETRAAWPRLGQRIGDRFLLDRWLGCGATGVVFAARDEHLDMEVAIKLLRCDPSRSPREQEALRSCLRREILVGRRVQHPNVARVYDIGQSDGYDYITMAL